MNAQHIFRYVYYLCAMVVAMTCATSGLAQPCVCVDCPQPIPTISDVQVCYDMAGLSNTTLGANGQAVCGVSLEFTHDYIENLSLTLTSPAGQQVQLLGPGLTGFSAIPTAGARWNIDLLDCSQPIFPHPGTGPQFSGSSAAWQVFGNYSGSYYPFNGCLSDFNAGPVNGTWCIRIQSNAIVTNNDRLVNFSIDFCDNDGETCCYADTPVSPSFGLDTILCQADSALRQSINFVPQTTVDYLNQLVISRNDTIIAYEADSFDLQTATAGSYEVCGISYWAGDSSSFPSIGTPIDTLINALNSGGICGERSVSCMRYQILPSVSFAVVDTTICEGDFLLVGGIPYGFSDSLQISLPSSGGCDSIIDLRLRVHPLDTTRLSESFCEGDTFRIAGAELTAGGNYSFRFSNQFGCDSLVELDLIEYRRYETILDTAFCTGVGIDIGGVLISSPGTFRQNLQTVNGCDSILTWNLVELDPGADIIYSDSLLTCDRLVIPLTGISSPVASGITSSTAWRGPGSTTHIGGTWSATLPGWYFLDQTLSFGGSSCTATDSVFIYQNTTSAVVSLPDTLQLTCFIDSLILAPQTGGGVLHTFSWNLPTGPSNDSLQIATTPGNYSVIVARLDNACRDTATAVVLENRQTPSVVFREPDTLTCLLDSVELDASGSFGPSFDVTWQTATGGSILTTNGIGQATAPGAYKLVVRDTLNGCVDSAFVNVYSDTSSLQLLLNVSDTLTCSRTSVDISVSADQSIASLVWTGPLGDTLGTTSPLSIGEAGNYEATVVSALNGCRVSSSLQVLADTIRPVARIQQPDTLRCFPPLTVLDASASSGVNALAFLWEYSSTQVIAGSATPRLSTAGGGFYDVIVTDQLNGCSDTATTELIEDRIPPIADAGVDGQITCSQSTVSLGDPTAATAGLDFRWTSSTGGIIGFPDGVVVTASLEGLYELTVTDTASGCIARDTVFVSRDQNVPLARVPDTTLIMCNQQFILLSGAGSSTGNTFSYAWTTVDGTIEGNANQQDISVSSNGTYRLTVTNDLTNCVGFAEAIVIDDCPAFVFVTSPDTINCFTGPRIYLEAQGNTGPGTSVRWEARTGRIISGGDTYAPEIEGGGWYLIEVSQQFTSTTALDSVFVEVDTVAPSARILNGLTLSCGDVSTCAELDASISSGQPGMTLTWSTLGGRFCGDTIGEFVRVNAAGIYEVIAFNPRNGCVDQASVVVDVEPGVPVPDAGQDQILLCEQDSLTLEAALPTTALNRQWWWVDATGSQLSDTGATMLTIDSAGTFAFVISDSLSGCTAVDSVHVIQQACAPNARPVASGNLNCIQDTIFLSSPAQQSMRFTWIGVDVAYGPVIGNEIEVWEAGEYRLVIQDSLFGLVDTAFVTVVKDTARPSAFLALPQNLTCDRDSVLLDARGSIGAHSETLTYTWLSSTVIPPPTGPVLYSMVSGRIELEVTSSLNGCKDTTSTLIGIDTLPPIAIALADGILDCVNNTVVLEGGQSTGQGSLFYEWGPLENQLLAVTDQSAISVSESGAYQLLITDQQNGCVALDTVILDQINESVVNAGLDQVIDCRTSVTSLNGTINTAGINVAWSSDTPGCISNPSSLTTQVSCVGSYYLSWTDSSAVCTYVDTVLVVEPTIGFELGIVGDTSLDCTTSILEFQGTSTIASVALRWEGIGTDLSPGREVIEPGNLVLIGTDSIGCSDTISQLVTIDTLQPILVVADPDTLTCGRPLVRLQGRNASTRSSLRYEWSSSELTDTLIGAFVRTSEAGTYTVRLVDTLNGCWDERSVEVAQDTTSPHLNLSTPLGDLLDCDVNSVLVEARLDPPNSLLSWNVPAGQSIVAGALTQNAEIGGIYQVTALHPVTGCPSTELVIVRDNSAPVGAYELGLSDALGCSADSIELQVTLPEHATASWTDVFGTPLSSDWVSIAGTYAIEVTDTITGCRSFDSIVVSQYVSPYELSLAGADTLDCETAFIRLTAETSGMLPNGLEYRWVSPRGDTVQRSSRPTYEVGEGGLWTVVSVDPITGCEQFDAVTIEVSGDAIQEVVVVTQDASCPGDRDGQIEIVAIEGGRGPFTFQLDGGEKQAVGQFGLLEGGRYELIVTDANNCFSTLEIVIDQTAPKEIDLVPRIEAYLGEELCLEFEIVGGGRPDSLLWSPSSVLSCDTCLVPCLVALSDYDLNLEVWFGGCLVESSTRIEVRDGANAVWPSGFSPNGDGSNDVWWVLPKGGTLSYCKVYDRWGSIVFSSQSDGQTLNQLWDGTQEGRPLNPAVFVVEVGGNNALGEPFVVFGDVTLIK